jgi:hypothetical protein
VLHASILADTTPFFRNFQPCDQPLRNVVALWSQQRCMLQHMTPNPPALAPLRNSLLMLYLSEQEGRLFFIVRSGNDRRVFATLAAAFEYITELCEQNGANHVDQIS